MRITKKLVDSQGNQLQELDHVMIYFGYNELKPGVVKEIKGQHAKVLVDAWPSHPDPEYRYSLSKWKRGECMVKVPNPDKPYPPEVYGLLNEIRRRRDESDDHGLRLVYQGIINYWEGNRPLRLVTS